jgi:glycosyltransferase involved in cell wall biosynthesis
MRTLTFGIARADCQTPGTAGRFEHRCVLVESATLLSSGVSRVKGSELAVSVVVPTRNRDEQIAGCVESILATTGFRELIVIDQSDGSATEKALARFSDPRLRYVRTDTRGVTIARNLGIDLSTGDIIACTDDDCRVAPDWASTISALFTADPEASVICGRVHVPGELNQSGGYAANFEPQVREWRGRYPPPDADWGITANLALRREVIARVGNFDPILGAGAPLGSGGEPDFIFRVLRAGLKVVNAREVVVEHVGVRAPGEETLRLKHRYAAGIGAAFYKHVRLGDRAAIRIYLSFLLWAIRLAWTNLLHFGGRPRGLRFLLGFVVGTLHSYRFRVDRELRQYVPR